MSVSPINKIQFHYLIPPFYFPSRTQLKNFLLLLFNKEGCQVDHINYIFCDDDYLLAINQNHLNHDAFTDIITFPYSKKGAPLLSDIYISVDRVKDNARLLKTSFLQELYRVILHGALHLTGYKDKTLIEKKNMRAHEDNYLTLFVSRGTP